jgi:hypothetical protein
VFIKKSRNESIKIHNIFVIKKLNTSYWEKSRGHEKGTRPGGMAKVREVVVSITFFSLLLTL